jgi:uncharacterized membrane protein
MKDTDKRTIAIFESLDQVEEAIGVLTAAGIKKRKISVVTQSLETETKIHGFMSHTDATRMGAETGAWTGGIFGLLVGAAFVWIPGFGPLLVAGPLAAALLAGLEGAAAGAAGGGLLGALLGHAVEKRHIPKYEEAIKSGKFLLVVSGSTEDVDQAMHILERQGGQVGERAF